MSSDDACARPACLIVSPRDDPHTTLVMGALREREIPCACFDATDVECRRVTLDIPRDRLLLEEAGRDVDLSCVKTVWLRRPEQLPQPSDPRAERRRAGRALLWTLFTLLRDRVWVNPLQRDAAAHYKPYQLQLAQEAGLEIPATLITNDPDHARAFFPECGHGMVYKSFEPTVRVSGSQRYGAYTSRVSDTVMTDLGDRIHLSPCLLQEQVVGGMDLRVTVIGRKVFAIAIDAPDRTAQRPDWRRVARTAHCRPVHLDAELETKILELLARLGLVFGCVDLVQTDDGSMRFLEVNPSGQWYWVEQRTGLPLLETFVDLLSAPDGAH